MESRNKILYVHHSGNLGGAPRSLSFLLNELDFNRYKPELLFISRGPGLELFKGRGIELILEERIWPFHGSTVSGMTFKLFLSNIFRFPSSFFAARRIVKRQKPDIIHLNSTCLFVVALAAKFVSRKIKVVCHVREPVLRKSISGFIIRYMNFLFTDQLIAIDNFSAKSMIGKNVKVIFNSVDLNVYNPLVKSDVLRRELDLKRNSTIFLYLARFSKSNGTLELVEAARKLKEKYPSFYFVLAGLKRTQLDIYSQMVIKESADNPNVHLIDFRDDIPSLIASSDIMIVPFTKPHFARSIVEASAMGKPSIGAKLGGIDDLIVHEKTGFLYQTSKMLLDYCIELGNNDYLREEMGNAAYKFAKENFDNKIISAKVFKIYKELLQS